MNKKEKKKSKPIQYKKMHIYRLLRDKKKIKQVDPQYFLMNLKIGH